MMSTIIIVNPFTLSKPISLPQLIVYKHQKLEWTDSELARATCADAVIGMAYLY
jgi:hypothetical protein